MAGKDDAEEATFDPTPQRLRQLREEGQVPRSQEVVDAVTLIAVLTYVVVMRDAYVEAFSAMLRDAPVFAPLPFADRVGATVAMLVDLTLRLVVPPVAIAIAAAILGTMIDVGGFLFTLKALAPNFSKFNPVEGFKNIFSLRSFIDLLKSAAKVVAFIVCCALIVRAHVNDMLWAPTCGVPCVVDVGSSILVAVLVVGCFLLILFAAVDYAISRWLFTRDNRMTLTEMKREMKENYGDPHVRGERQAERKRIADLAGLVGPNAANIWIVGPDGAIGLAYKPQQSGVPIVAAKARGDAAVEFLAKARSNGIAVVQDEALFATLATEGKVTQPIPRSTYGPVAQTLVRAGFSG